MGKHIVWCKNNIFLCITCALLAFIPLYPKLPLFDVFGTWVNIRIEDVLVAGALGLYLLTRIIEKKKPQTSLTTPIVLYWIVGLISVVISIWFIGPRLANYFPHLAVMHFIRRIEYMGLFFIAYEAIRKIKRVEPILWVLGGTALCIIAYGFGQKFLGWPAFLTMNEEFAKGIPLRLPPTARIPSTFGGHYDLGAFLVLVIPIFGSMVFGFKEWWKKILFFLFAVGSLLLLLMTASRISFGVYLVAIVSMLAWQKKWIWIIPVVILSFVMLNSVSVASDRFYKTFRFSDVIVDLSTGRPIGTLDKLEGGTATVETQEKPDEENLPKGTEFIGVGGGQKQTAKTIEFYKSHDLATGSGDLATVSGSFLIQKAFVYDISITTRFQGQWPKAIEAFKRNMLTGSGYSTLSVASDGDYFRMLGETGILGSIAFLGILYFAFTIFLRMKERLDVIPRAYVIGLFAGIVGLLLNAILIDVFEASKVAYTYWMLLGAGIALMDRIDKKNRSYLQVLPRAFTGSFALGVYLVIAVFLVFGKALSGYFIGDDFTWLRWAAQSSIYDMGTFFSQSDGFFWRPIPKLWYFILYSVFWLKPLPYLFVSLSLYSFIVLSLWKILTKMNVKPVLAWFGALMFAVMAVHHENVFWISGQSSLLSGACLFAAIAVFMNGWVSTVKTHRVLYHASGILLMVLSMLSYDGMLVAPILIWIIGSLYGKKRLLDTGWVLFFVPVYLWIRSYVHAVPPSGDYGVNIQKLPFNGVGNTVTYLVSMVIGPRAMELSESIRLVLKTYTSQLRVALGIVGVLFIACGYAIRRRILRYRVSLIWALAGCISLSAYIGLGGNAERYVLFASGFFVISFITGLDTWIKQGVSIGIRILILTLGIGVLLWNIGETQRIATDWGKAYLVSRQTLLTLKQEFFPLRSKATFIFVNTPIRYGRAWIFPTGMEDAMWHLFRGNDYTVRVGNDVPSALGYSIRNGDLYVLSFDGYKIQRMTKEIQIIEE
jgi:hypothetical protein